MKTLDEVIGILQRQIERTVLEDFIAREWVRPYRSEDCWYFEEIDIARLELICHLTQDIKINDEGMDVALSLIDQLYTARSHMRRLTHAITRQAPEVQMEIKLLLAQSAKTDEKME